MFIYSNFVHLPNTFYIKATHTLQMCSICDFRQKEHSNHWALWFSYNQSNPGPASIFKTSSCLHKK